MKNRFLKTSLVTFGFLACSAGCNQSQKSVDEKNKEEIVNDNFQLKTP
jgi:hypothetical protein